MKLTSVPLFDTNKTLLLERICPATACEIYQYLPNIFDVKQIKITAKKNSNVTNGQKLFSQLLFKVYVR